MFSTIWNTVFFNPLLNVMIIFYHYLGDNLGLAILGIAIIARIVMIPLVKKQTGMTKKMASLKPQLDELQKKYANNKEKLASEQMKLYKKTGYNPLGCIGTFIPQLVILSVLIAVIRAVTASDLDGLYTWVKDLTGISDGISINTKFLSLELTKSYKELSSEFGKFSIESLPYIVLSILVGVVQYFTTVFTQKMQNVTTPKKETKGKKEGDTMGNMQASMQKSTMYFLPLITVFFTISMPAALGWYWMVQSLLLVIQYVSLDFDKTKKGIQNLLDLLHKKEK
jgi:YidC/Oxa1 family membrane protein insertase